MKTLLIIIIGLLAHVSFAGTVTINTTPQQDVRIQAAVRAILNLDHDPNAAEIKAWLIDFIRSSVQDYERRQNIQQYTPTPIDPT